jgi:hypothetical protein
VPEAQRTRGGARPASGADLRPAPAFAFVRDLHAAVRVEHDLRGVLEVAFVHVRELAGDACVLDGDVELVVADPAREIEVGRSHARPAGVRDRRFRVQHRAVPFEDAYVRFEERPVARA